MFERRRAPAALAGRLLNLVQLWWRARPADGAAAPRLDFLNDHLRRDVGLEPRSPRYPLDWPWQRF